MNDQCLNGRQEHLIRVGLQQKCTGACLERLQRKRIRIMHCENENLRWKLMFPDAPCNFYPRHKGHRVVNNGNVGPLFDSPSDRLVAIVRLDNNLPANMPFQKGT
jgi:hypothetical protein